MDIFGTTVLVIGEVYKITMFIRGVVSDVKGQDSERQDIKGKLDHELLFLDSFKALFFDDNGVFVHVGKLPLSVKDDIDMIIKALKKSLAEYEVLATKYGVLREEGSGEPETEVVTGKVEDTTSFYKRVQSKVKEIKKRTVDWALFDKEKLIKTLATYTSWTERLRQTMSLMLLTLAAFDKGAFERFASIKTRDIRLQRVVDRQILAQSKPPENFNPLDGHILEGSEFGTSSNVRLARYENNWGGVEEVVVEYRKYDSTLIQATDYKSPMLDDFKTPIRNLAWLLSGSFSPDGQTQDLDSYEQPNLFTLPFLGFIDEPKQYRVLFLYKLPRPLTLSKNTSIVTLHDLIDTNDRYSRPGSRPSLGNRFFLAHALASTIFNIHSFGWVHKNVWSRGVVIFPDAVSSSPSENWRLVPYLTGWGLARPVLGATELAVDTDIEPNFYRHPSRQGNPKCPFDIEHDIYALGIVLLEIGLWETISSMFKININKAISDNQLPEAEEIRKALIDRARADLGSEMGESYMRAVERCLMGEFEVAENEDLRAGLLVAFRKMVIEVVAEGMKL